MNYFVLDQEFVGRLEGPKVYLADSGISNLVY